MTIRYALVGLGHIAQVAVLPAFAHASRNSVLTALVSGDPAKRSALAARYAVSTTYGYDQYERCLAEVDAVYLALPNHLHAAFAIRAAKASVHVLCEKPLAVTTADCTAIIDACSLAGVTLMVAHRLHYDPMTRDLHDRVRRGDIGDPRFFEGVFSFIAGPGRARAGGLGDGGGTLYDIGVYCINAARRFFDAEPVEVTAVSLPGAGHPVDDLTAAILRFDASRLAVFTTSFSAAGLGAYRLVGTTGHIRAEPAFAYTGELAYDIVSGGSSERRVFQAGHPFAAELLHFSDCILTGSPPDSPGTDGLHDVRVIEALLASAATGRAVSPGDGASRPSTLQPPRV